MAYVSELSWCLCPLRPGLITRNKCLNDGSIDVDHAISFCKLSELAPGESNEYQTEFMTNDFKKTHCQLKNGWAVAVTS